MDTHIIECRSVGMRHTAVATATLGVPEIGPWLSRIYGELVRALHLAGNAPIGPPFARYHRMEEGRFDVEAGFPVARPVKQLGEFRGSALPGGTVAIATHIGPYDDLEVTYQALSTWIASRDSVPEGDPWETYFSAPDDPPATWRTEVTQPYRAA